MSKKGIIGGVVIAAGISAVLFGVSYTPTEANQSVSRSRIIGTFVERGTNRPIIAELALTTLDEGHVLLKHTTASRQGEFAIDSLEPGQFHLVTKAEGYAVEHRDISLNQGEILRADFQLEAFKRVRGTVRGPNGVPISGANVRVIYSAAMPGLGDVASTYQWETGDVKTDLLGTFVIEIHPGKEFILEASHPQFLGAISTPITNPPDLNEIITSLSLRSGINLTGEVKNEAGTAVFGAQVRMLNVAPRPASPRFISIESLSQRIKYTRSGANGLFRFEQTAPGRKMLIVLHPGYRPFRQVIDLSTNQGSPHAIVILRAVE